MRVANMATTQEKEEVFNHWNTKNIVQHRRMNADINKALVRTLQYYPVAEVKDLIDFYATILEPGVPELQKVYFWSYKWNLYEFLMRGIKKFDGQETTNYLKNKTPQVEAIVFSHKVNKQK